MEFPVPGGKKALAGTAPDPGGTAQASPLLCSPRGKVLCVEAESSTGFEELAESNSPAPCPAGIDASASEAGRLVGASSRTRELNNA